MVPIWGLWLYYFTKRIWNAFFTHLERSSSSIQIKIWFWLAEAAADSKCLRVSPNYDACAPAVPNSWTRMWSSTDLNFEWRWAPSSAEVCFWFEVICTKGDLIDWVVDGEESYEMYTTPRGDFDCWVRAERSVDGSEIGGDIDFESKRGWKLVVSGFIVGVKCKGKYLKFMCMGLQ